MKAAVLDTNVLISATLWDGSEAQKLLFKLIELDVKIFSSSQILAEYEKVLKRDFDYHDEEVSNIIEKIMSFASLVAPNKTVDVVKDDPEDNKIIACAIESSADCIITYDKHLLNIAEFNGIKIIKPEEAMSLLY
ncbi:MAG: putative toxin-antitoxin system toxin component, PIN family [Nanoarchaeota archaeon]|nr:putative toxin-antitoxin system toxin component, PIN family [Nanoarchaeota archaeon]